MLFQLVRPMKRKGSSNAQFIKRIPADLRDRLTGKLLAVPVGDELVPVSITPNTETIRLSLRASDPSEVRERQGAVTAYLEKVFRHVRTESPISLTHRQAVALAGDLYRSWASDVEKARTLSLVHTEAGWQRDTITPQEAAQHYEAAERSLAELEGEEADLEKPLGPLLDHLLLSRGVPPIDSASRSMALSEFLSALRQGMAVRQRKASGDYNPDPQASRFPEWQSPGERPKASSGASLMGLVEAWWQEASASGHSLSTYESYRNAVARLVAFLGHDDASRVSPEDVIRFKDHRLWRDNLDERRATIWMRIWCRGGGNDRGNDCRAQEFLLV